MDIKCKLGNYRLSKFGKTLFKNIEKKTKEQRRSARLAT